MPRRVRRENRPRTADSWNVNRQSKNFNEWIAVIDEANDDAFTDLPHVLHSGNLTAKQAKKEASPSISDKRKNSPQRLSPPPLHHKPQSSFPVSSITKNIGLPPNQANRHIQPPCSSSRPSYLTTAIASLCIRVRLFPSESEVYCIVRPLGSPLAESEVKGAMGASNPSKSTQGSPFGGDSHCFI